MVEKKAEDTMLSLKFKDEDRVHNITILTVPLINICNGKSNIYKKIRFNKSDSK